MRLCDVNTGHQIAVLAQHKDSVRGVAFLSNSQICSVGMDKTAYIHEARSA